VALETAVRVYRRSKVWRRSAPVHRPQRRHQISAEKVKGESGGDDHPNDNQREFHAGILSGRA
jgi:hypothetical protein